jgi:hypothetical protein
MDSLSAIFWVELSEHLIRETTCTFKAFGEFKRFASTLSFIPELLWQKEVLPNILHESGDDFGLDALCRLALEPVRLIARQTFKHKYRGSPQSFPQFGAELLRDRLQAILAALKPPAQFAASFFSHGAALAGYYAWAIAFDAAIQTGFLPISGVGNFKLAGTVVNRVDFSADDNFWKLIMVNAQKPPLPDEIGPSAEAA